ncbi:IspD/TarI family cytidylyltransferase [Breznakiella homolactica]|nr:2-C-methyl-D-erythritol 4-phosphate cytidylyltransferase [Breznakiella homolactica]
MGGVKKEYRCLNDAAGGSPGNPLTVLGAAVTAFASVPGISYIVITVPPDPEQGEFAARKALPPHLTAQNSSPKLLFVPGGLSRRESVHHALSLLAAYPVSHVLIHDGARPWVSRDLICRTMETVIQYRAVVPLVPLIETPKETDSAGFVIRHPKRSSMGTAQTPQGFAFPDILRAHEGAAEREISEGIEYTDDAEVWGEFIGKVASIPGESGNRKITFPQDLPEKEQL